MRRLKHHLSAALVAALCCFGGAVAAQTGASPILVIDQERLFRESELGNRITQELEDAAEALGQENRRIEAELTAEELELTERRSELPANEFRELADAFDEKVQRLRAQQDAKQVELERRQAADQQVFLNEIGPILGQVAQERGADIVLDRRAAFLVSDSIDVTDVVIRRVNESVAQDGTLDLPPAPENDLQEGAPPVPEE